jgi:aspartate-semialdehyde dehydrogenase
MRVGVVGATGQVGGVMRRLLAERNFPVDEIRYFASSRSAGTTLPWNGADIVVEDAETADPSGLDIALFSAGATSSKACAPKFATAGAVVIDNSSAWRMHPRVPLVVPEVNGAAAEDRPLGIIANPNCATIQLVMALAPLQRRAGLRRVIVTTLQAVSGAGQTGVAALQSELAGAPAPQSPFVAPIAGNVIPWIGPRREDGWNEEEEKIRAETRRILDLDALPVAATCVRVPVHTGHSISATVELEEGLSPRDLRAALEAMDGLEVYRADRDPLARDVAGTDAVRVGRVRADRDIPNVVHLWIVSDNLRKGAATNAVQIAELVARSVTARHG